MIKLTEKGKEVYGDVELFISTGDARELIYHYRTGGYAVIAIGAVEIKALLDMGLIEIE